MIFVRLRTIKEVPLNLTVNFLSFKLYTKFLTIDQVVLTIESCLFTIFPTSITDKQMDLVKGFLIKMHIKIKKIPRKHSVPYCFKQKV